MKNGNFELAKIVRRFRGLAVGILGDLMLDELLWGDATRISPEAPVPVVLVSNQRSPEAFPGGAGNVAANVAALGGQAAVFGALGNDPAAVELTRLLTQRGVDVGGLVREAGRVTPRKVRIAAHQQQLLRLDFEKPGPIAPRTERLLARRLARRLGTLKALVVSEYLKGSVTPHLCGKVMTHARRHRVPVLVDPKPERPEICRYATLATPNLHEAERMAGAPLSDLEARRRSAPALREKLGCEALLITRGGDGMTLVEPDGGLHEVHSQSRPIYDVTGAGDTVIAVMALALAAGATLRQAAKLANIAGGCVVLKFGTASLSTAELLAALRK
jgi:rfaE bifunctional protein kinase chain/domain